jgi:hypothetical protein
VDGATGVTGATGAGLTPGFNYSDYLFWDTSISPEGAWEVGSSIVHIGADAGFSGQGAGCVAIGSNSGQSGQLANSIAIGNLAGNSNQGISGPFNSNTGGSVAIGNSAGLTSQQVWAISIGSDAGANDQQDRAIAIGYLAGNQRQGQNSIAIGTQALAGSLSQLGGSNTIAIGATAGLFGQGARAIAIGDAAAGDGSSRQGQDAIAIGANAGRTNQGINAIAIGNYAGSLAGNQAADSIILYARGVTGGGLGCTGPGFYVQPLTEQAAGTPQNGMYYDTDTREIRYDSGKTFVIDHPTDPNRYLVHACLEGPEAGVYYRGEAELVGDEIRIELPAYVSSIAHNFTVQLTQIRERKEEPFARLSSGRVVDGAFTVSGDPCTFAWHVHGTRQLVETEPAREDVAVFGDGPYKYIRSR